MDAFAGLLSWASEVLPSYVFCCDNSMGSSHTAAKSRRTICNEGDLPRSGTYLPVIKFKQINKRDLFYYVYLDSSLLKKMLGPSERVLASKTPLSSLFRVSCNRMVDWLGSLQGRKGAFPCLKKTTIYIHVGIKKKGDDLEDLLKDQILLILLETPKKSSGFRPLILFPISSFNRSTALPQLPHARQRRRRLKVTEVCLSEENLPFLMTPKGIPLNIQLTIL